MACWLKKYDQKTQRDTFCYFTWLKPNRKQNMEISDRMLEYGSSCFPLAFTFLLFFVLIVHVHVVVVVSKEWTDGRRETFRTPRWRPLVLIKSVPKKWTIKFKNNETRLPIFEKEIPCFRPNSRQLEPARHHEMTKSWNKFFFRPSAFVPPLSCLVHFLKEKAKEPQKRLLISFVVYNSHRIDQSKANGDQTRSAGQSVGCNKAKWSWSDASALNNRIPGRDVKSRVLKWLDWPVQFSLTIRRSDCGNY